MCLLWHTTGIVCSPSLKNKSQLGLVKNQERQQCCDNPRVKGVNMWREFHAWQVRRMASVFSLFTHANEQYADEQTWAQPRLPAAQSWHKACWCGSVTSPQIPLVCCRIWWLFKRLMHFRLQAQSLPCTVSRIFSVFGSNWNSLSSKLCSLKSPWNCILIASYLLKLHISCSNTVLQWALMWWEIYK